ncbi:MAG: Glycine dehydrogenase [decarboxylating] (glycine cleavage system P1 protein) [uncultured Chloroflexia bacterium]|uniref:Probable glycine dehydrogenase (decarboxylating) subunit 1 n=1 Tax=uncultured Chloroflexia bacterium TaxID=1672391 RepID=A0A6J4JHI3_9CHLR|nr:MAG: Glycine dehydrogenase [decarboxylating] (glycine cleavage system P1 protein) [uncultured Chloroflexia bacterium]
MSHYISNTERDRDAMLEAIGVGTIDELFEVVPSPLRFPELRLPAPLSEPELMRELRRMSDRNTHALASVSFLGAGAYHHFVPSAVDSLLRRGEFLTAYTPYQPELSQGTLQAIFEYQTMICALTGMDAANASHYDGATALAEAAGMAVSSTRNRRTILVSPTVHPQYRETLRTYTQGHGLTITGDEDPAATMETLLGRIDGSTAAVIVQTPDFLGQMHDLRPIAEAIHAAGGLLVASVDPIALGLFQNPGTAGADIVTAEGQPLGIPLSFGGPYLGIFACKEQYIRRMPGRLAGATTDMNGEVGYVLTLQTREQHIRREKATSNICTNQGLMALAATVYMSLLGKQGLRKVAHVCYQRANYAASELAKLPGFEVATPEPFFKEFVLRTPRPAAEINSALVQRGIIGGYDLETTYPHLGPAMLVCVTEMNTRADIDMFVAALREL